MADTWEQRMAQRARRAAIKRRLRNNLEGVAESEDSLALITFYAGRDFEPVTAHHYLLYSEPREDKWPEVID